MLAWVMGKNSSRHQDKQEEAGGHSAILEEKCYKEEKKSYNIKIQDEQQERHYNVPAHCKD